MKIIVVGTGYVGLVSGACFADMGNDVWCVDINEEKINMLKKGRIPIYEPALDEIVKRNYDSKRLNFTTDLSYALKQGDICFIAVGTPMGEDGSADLHYVLGVAKEIGQHMDKHMYIVDKSTVPVGTAQKVRMAVQKELDLRNSTLTFDIISNPEFLKEGTAVADCCKPDRVVIGTDNKNAEEVMRELYLPFMRSRERIICMDIASAEMTKYTANSMLATKISFMNEIANICELVGADVNKVRQGIGSDQRIGYHFIYAGCGYGGSCFPKDVQAIIKSSGIYGYEPKILKAVENVNKKQKLKIPEKVTEKFGENLEGKTFAVWGLSFKPETDDMRESAAITIINELTKRGAKINAYDPKAMEEAKKCYLKGNDKVTYFDSKYAALTNADAMILVTEWKEFRSPDFMEIKKLLTKPIIFDGRNQYDMEILREYGFEYYQIGVGIKTNN
ncbi:MAG TPA: UDP-glucose/GDP-mannose dehydrogenase family protein [Oscillospiraceae bacterium]|nr:UDP-glucose/GDP-mannose dehydrogenase family protein [Oscillospiraceae bacterium]